MRLSFCSLLILCLLLVLCGCSTPGTAPKGVQGNEPEIPDQGTVTGTFAALHDENRSGAVSYESASSMDSSGITDDSTGAGSAVTAPPGTTVTSRTAFRAVIYRDSDIALHDCFTVGECNNRWCISPLITGSGHHYYSFSTSPFRYTTPDTGNQHNPSSPFNSHIAGTDSTPGFSVISNTFNHDVYSADITWYNYPDSRFTNTGTYLKKYPPRRYFFSEAPEFRRNQSPEW